MPTNEQRSEPGHVSRGDQVYAATQERAMNVKKKPVKLVSTADRWNE